MDRFIFQTPLKCFERAAEKCHIDSLSSIVGSSLWGKNNAIGTGKCFQILWKQKDVQSEANIGNDVYDFIHMVRATTGEMESDTCLGVDMDNLVEENGDLSPDHDLCFVKPTFDDSDICLNHENPQNEMQDKWDMDSSNWNTESQGWGVSKIADATSSKNAAWDENNSLGGDVGGSDSSNWNKQAQSEPPY
ncbi:hypothetical protein ZOSMA_122G00050 [Zostera marina]|uniref:DNA-directed RNA polymerase n=1 Tax=Zostera marina TaxID=29655 RepID=A0A0K9Q0B1_ZOSMR|nr:hypothetical protein ZOSMA_122G00050 [Zostera marina]